jgi:hypothetical protein
VYERRDRGVNRFVTHRQRGSISADYYRSFLGESKLIEGNVNADGMKIQSLKCVEVKAAAAADVEHRATGFTNSTTQAARTGAKGRT